jgi:hypothetical protein
MTRFHKLFPLCALTLAAVPALAKGPGVVKFDEVSFEVSEAAGSAVIAVERSGGEDGAVSIHYATSDGTATAGQDYTATAGTLSWAAGDEGTKTFSVAIHNDTAAEGTETVQLTLSNPTGGATVDADRGTSVLRILANDDGSGGGGGGGGGDDHGDGAIKFDQGDFQVIEGRRTAVITVERSHGETGAVSVQYATANGTATAGQDYQAASGTLSWAAGDESRKSFAVQILDDSAQEGTETVRLALSNPTGGATLDDERATAVLTILDAGPGGDGNGGDDGNRNGPGVIKIDDGVFQALEGAGVARVVVERSHGETGTVSVRWATADGSAHQGEDYTAASGVLTWAAGDGRNKVIEVPVLDDAADEGNETVRVVLSDPAGGATIDPERKAATVTIVDDDASTSACVDDDDTLCLLDDRFKVEVVWRTPQGGIGVGHEARLTGKAGTFWFFDRDNVEMLVKVLDACQGFGNHWVFFAATTNVDFTVTVTDTRTGVVKQYTNPAGRAAAPVQDTFTFPCGG